MVLINSLLITMSIYYYNYMSDEYRIFVSKNKLRVTTLTLEEANAVIYGDGADSVISGQLSTFRENINNVRASFLDGS